MRLLDETLSTHIKYGSEYMDEHPITGAPGDFHISRSTASSQSLPGKDKLGGTEALLTAREEWERLLEKEIAEAKIHDKSAGATVLGGEYVGKQAEGMGAFAGTGALKKGGKTPRQKTPRTPALEVGESMGGLGHGSAVGGMPKIKRKKSKTPGGGSPITAA